jgi:hypothetical protein
VKHRIVRILGFIVAVSLAAGIATSSFAKQSSERSRADGNLVNTGGFPDPGTPKLW